MKTDGGFRQDHYGRETQQRKGQDGERYPDLSREGNPLETVKRLYRRTPHLKEDEKTLQEVKEPTIDPTHVDTYTDRFASKESGPSTTGRPMRDRYSDLDTNYRDKWIRR